MYVIVIVIGKDSSVIVIVIDISQCNSALNDNYH